MIKISVERGLLITPPVANLIDSYLNCRPKLRSNQEKSTREKESVPKLERPHALLDPSSKNSRDIVRPGVVKRETGSRLYCFSIGIMDVNC